MLLELKVKNFRSIKDWQSFSMLSENKIKELPDNQVEFIGQNVLTSAIVYGRNASGKSNILKAFNAIQYLVLDSSKFKIDKKIPPYEPYKLDAKYKKSPTEISIDFIAKDKVRYIYEVGFNDDVIEYEILKFYPKSQSAILFERHNGQPIKYGDYLTGKKRDVEEMLYPNQLFLSKVGVDKIDKLTDAYLFFSEKMYVSLSHNTNYDNALIAFFTKKMADDTLPYFKENINVLMRVADTGIDCINIKEEDIDFDNLPKDMTEDERNNFRERYKYKIRTVHKTFDGEVEVGKEEFKLQEESTGTIKLLAMGGLILEALVDGQLLIIDELDKSLHPKLTRALIKIFHSKKTNPNNAQLIFASHDVSLLDNELFRRDQIWFAEKEFEGCSHYYSISDITGIRPNVPLEKYYMTGRFGAMPMINENDLIFQF